MFKLMYHNRHVYVSPPDTVFLMFLSATSGALSLTGLSASDAVQSIVPFWVGVAWGALLTLGAIIALIGIFWRDPVTGLEIEAAGRWMLGPASVAYTVALVAYADGIFFPALFVLAFGIACMVRLVDISRMLREWKAYASELG